MRDLVIDTVNNTGDDYCGKERSVSEIAKLLGMGNHTVNKILDGAIEKLEIMLREHKG